MDAEFDEMDDECSYTDGSLSGVTCEGGLPNFGSQYYPQLFPCRMAEGDMYFASPMAGHTYDKGMDELEVEIVGSYHVTGNLSISVWSIEDQSSVYKLPAIELVKTAQPHLLKLQTILRRSLPLNSMAVGHYTVNASWDMPGVVVADTSPYICCMLCVVFYIF